MGKYHVAVFCFCELTNTKFSSHHSPANCPIYPKINFPGSRTQCSSFKFFFFKL